MPDRPVRGDSGSVEIVEPIGRGGVFVERAGGDGIEAGRVPSVRVVRPRDLVELTFSFQNLVFNKGKPPVLTRDNERAPARIVVTFPTQHLTEFTFFEGGGKEMEDPKLQHPPVRSLAGGPSRLVLLVTDEQIPYTVEGLLGAFGALQLHVPRAAVPQKPVYAKVDEIVGRIIAGRLLKIPARDRSAETSEAVFRLKSMVGRMAYHFGPDAAVNAAAGVEAARYMPGLAGLVEGPRNKKPDLLAQLAPEDPFGRRDVRTGIEIPFRLLLAPHSGLRFWNSATPVEHDGKVELWHTRLAERTAREHDGPAEKRTVRAVWTRDWEWHPYRRNPDPGTDFPSEEESQPNWRMPLTARERMGIVHQTSNFQLRKGRRLWVPQAVQVRRLMLSALGGWLDSRVVWDTQPDGFSLEEWLHRASMGRDYEVKVVEAGFLFPFGHRASLMTITERRFEELQGRRIAYLIQRQFILVKQAQKTYGSSGYTLPGGRRVDNMMPLSAVRIVTRITPQLDEAPSKPFGTSEGEDPLYFPQVNKRRFKFKVVAADMAGNLAEFAIPLLFVGKGRNDGPIAGIKQIANDYDADTGEKAGSLNGQRVAFAAPRGPDDTRVDVQSIRFSGAVVDSMAKLEDEPKFSPIVKDAQAVIPAIAHLTGSTAPATVAYPEAYAKHGFKDGANQNPGEVFLGVTGVDLDFTSQSDRSGGLASPSIQVSGLSRLTGPVGGKPEEAAGGTFNPQEFFKALAGAKLFGVVPLTELAAKAGFKGELDAIPKFISESITIVGALVRDLSTLSARLGALGPAANDVKQKATALAVKLDPAKLKSGLPAESDFTDLAAAVTALLNNDATKAPAQRDIRAALERVKAVLADIGKLRGFIESVASGALVPEVVNARLAREPKLQNWPATGPIFEQDPGARMVIAVDVRAATDKAVPPAADVSCKVEKFHLNLLPKPNDFICIPFEHISFEARAGRKPEVDVKMGAIEFLGVLEFVKRLEQLIPSDGFSDPPYLDVDASGLSAGYSLGLPPIAVGVFSLENISLGADVRVPFIGEALEFRFSFCTRERPFHLIVSLFGGGGFFGITITPKGLRVLEAALEFGAAISINLGVASGSVSIMAGIYFRMEVTATGQDKAALSGYFRLRGEVDVLGLISACIELYLEFTYEFSSGKCVGRATIFVEVEVLFFSATVEISCEKKFAGSKGDPTFKHLMAPQGAVKPWDRYCACFAKVA